MVDVVNGRDEVIGSAPRKGVHGTGMMHRSAHIFLIDGNGRIWLEKRASTTDTYPGYYSSSAAGHVRKGETYVQGARREALEELGIRGLRLSQVHKLDASSETSNEFVAFFIARSDSAPRRHELTDSLRAYTIPEIDGMIAEKVDFTPIFLMLYRWYVSNVA